jgi:hypothetical protein
MAGLSHLAAFEGGDGNLVPDTDVDWQDFVGSSELEIGTDLPTGQDDDSLQGKENDVAPNITYGSIPNNKSDLLRFYLVHENRNVGGEDKDILDIAWVRANTLGTANMDFEFNQSRNLSANGVTNERTVGDMLITYAFSSGANEINLGISRWVESGECEAGSPPCWSPIMPLNGIAQAAVNVTEVTDTVDGATLQALTFGEAEINLTDAGVFNRDECVTFGSAYVKSRSSDSFTASMKDFIRPIDVRVSNCSTVTIVKDAIPDDTQDFTFEPSGSLEAPAFDLDDDGDDSNGLSSEITLETRAQGPYSVSELPVEGWDLTDVTCTEGGSVDPASGELTIDVPQGASVECTFVNTKRGRIIIDEVTVPGGDPQPFDFILAGGPDGLLDAFVLTDPSVPHDSGTVRPGTYSVVQHAVPGWDLTNATCDDGSPVDAVVVDPGETVTCTFVNTKRGSIVVDKVTVPAADPRAFTFDLTGGPDGIGIVFSLTDAAAPHNSGAVRPGTYAVAESVPTGWDLTSVVCDDGSSSDAIDLAPGEIVTCTFTNTKRGTIVIDKVTDPAGDPQVFDFGLTGGPDGVSQGFGLTDATAPHGSGSIKPGTYSVTETVPSGWDLTSATCDDGSDPSAIGLEPGESITCTFTNTKRGTIVIDKVTDPAGDPQVFDFGLTGGPDGVSQSFGLADATAPYDSGVMRPGTYSVTETVPVGWDLTSATCDDGSDPEAIALGPGETVACTFTNVKRGKIIVDKFVANEPGQIFNPRTLPFEFDPSWGGRFFLIHGESNESEPLLPNRAYSISESVPSGWVATSECLYPDGTTRTGGSSINISLPAGAEVFCTFTNEMRIHPGSSGFWRNWRNHYTDGEFRTILVSAFNGSPVYAHLFDWPTGELRPDAITVIDRLYDFGGGTTGTEQKLLVEFTTTMLNVGVSELDETTGTNLQSNDDICRDCLLDLDGNAAREQMIIDWAPCEVPGALRIGDVIDIAEAIWNGNIVADSYAYVLMTESEMLTLTDILEEINHGINLDMDPDTYPDDPGCLKAYGPQTFTWYLDEDGDGHGLLGTRTQTCTDVAPDGYAPTYTDCDDASPNTYPGAVEVCDGVNNDCFDPIYPALGGAEIDGDGDTFSECAGDCDDANSVVYPGAVELCDGVNNDCSSATWPNPVQADRDDDGDSISECAGDCDDTNAWVFPGAPDSCDGLNNDCNDPGWPTVSADEIDNDGDGFAECAGDCDDHDGSRNPGAVEVCNGIDDDCNALPDDDSWGVDSDGDGIQNACDNCVDQGNGRQIDSDGDGIGDACDNCRSVFNDDQANADSDAWGDVCDGCPDTYSDVYRDFDLDLIPDDCDNCAFESNPDQADHDGDQEGDLCDLDDGMIYMRFDDRDSVQWQTELGFGAWNFYRGDLDVLRSQGLYTQAPGSNPIAEHWAGLTENWLSDPFAPAPGQAAFFLATGLSGGVESGLGRDSVGNERPNDNPCP